MESTYNIDVVIWAVEILYTWCFSLNMSKSIPLESPYDHLSLWWPGNSSLYHPRSHDDTKWVWFVPPRGIREFHACYLCDYVYSLPLPPPKHSMSSTHTKISPQCSLWISCWCKLPLFDVSRDDFPDHGVCHHCGGGVTIRGENW